MHLHLHPVGGIAGDMFCAALLDLQPHLLSELKEELQRLNPPPSVSVALVEAEGELRGSRFLVNHQTDDHAHTHYSTIRQLLESAGLPPGTFRRAAAIFQLLAEAEGHVHRVEPNRVTFHEVGNWDSLIDIVSAAWLLERLEIHSVSCEPLPLGGGRIGSEHGVLPVPAPATARLLGGMKIFDDGIPGERVTPTGAAILRALEPDFAGCAPGRWIASGFGFGSRKLPDLPNCLQASLLETAAEGANKAGHGSKTRVLEIAFEVDDQSPEDLAIGLDRLREVEGVLSVTSFIGTGKQGRLTVGVRVLAGTEHRAAVVSACLSETTTIGLRVSEVMRVVLEREGWEREHEGQPLEVKRATRPDGSVTIKAESRSIAAAGDRSARERLRRVAEEGGGSEGSR